MRFGDRGTRLTSRLSPAHRAHCVNRRLKMELLVESTGRSSRIDEIALSSAVTVLPHRLGADWTRVCRFMIAAQIYRALRIARNALNHSDVHKNRSFGVIPSAP